MNMLPKFRSRCLQGLIFLSILLLVLNFICPISETRISHLKWKETRTIIDLQADLDAISFNRNKSLYRSDGRNSNASEITTDESRMDILEKNLQRVRHIKTDSLNNSVRSAMLDQILETMSNKKVEQPALNMLPTFVRNTDGMKIHANVQLPQSLRERASSCDENSVSVVH